jgi:hypothetical protein
MRPGTHHAQAGRRYVLPKAGESPEQQLDAFVAV